MGGKSKNSVPDDWEKYSEIGSRIPGTRFIAFKVPLKERICENRLPEDMWWMPANLLEACTRERIGLIIDLTATSRYYDPEFFQDQGIQHCKIHCPGAYGDVDEPPQDVIDKFFDAVDAFVDVHEGDEKLIGVHCTHGVNRTGYAICRYLIEKQDFKVEQAVREFGKARGHDMEKYIEKLAFRETEFRRRREMQRKRSRSRESPKQTKRRRKSKESSSSDSSASSDSETEGQVNPMAAFMKCMMQNPMMAQTMMQMASAASFPMTPMVPSPYGPPQGLAAAQLPIPDFSRPPPPIPGMPTATPPAVQYSDLGVPSGFIPPDFSVPPPSVGATTTTPPKQSTTVKTLTQSRFSTKPVAAGGSDSPGASALSAAASMLAKSQVALGLASAQPASLGNQSAGAPHDEERNSATDEDDDDAPDQDPDADKPGTSGLADSGIDESLIKLLGLGPQIGPQKEKPCVFGKFKSKSSKRRANRRKLRKMHRTMRKGKFWQIKEMMESRDEEQSQSTGCRSGSTSGVATPNSSSIVDDDAEDSGDGEDTSVNA